MLCYHFSYLFLIYLLDPKIKARVRKYLAQSSNHHYSDLSDIDLSASITSPQKLSPNAISAKPHGICHRVTSSDPTCRPSRIPTIVKSPVHNTSRSCPQSPHGLKSKLPTIANGTSNNTLEEPSKQARFEAYIMTGDVIFNYSRTPPTPVLAASHNKKVIILFDICNQIYRTFSHSFGSVLKSISYFH